MQDTSLSEELTAIAEQRKHRNCQSKSFPWLLVSGVLALGLLIGSLGFWGISSLKQSRDQEQYLAFLLAQGQANIPFQDRPYELERLREDLQDQRAKTVLLANVNNENAQIVKEIFPWDWRAQSLVTFGRDWRLSRTPSHLAIDQRQANWLRAWTQNPYGYYYPY